MEKEPLIPLDSKKLTIFQKYLFVKNQVKSLKKINIQVFKSYNKIIKNCKKYKEETKKRYLQIKVLENKLFENKKEINNLKRENKKLKGEINYYKNK